MENKDLDNFFKDRAPQFDEQPGDALWAKIESGLDAPAPKQGGKGGLSLGKWLLLLAGIIGVVFIIAFLFTGESLLMSLPSHEGYETVTTEIQETTQQPADTVKTKKVAQKPAKKQKTGKRVSTVNNAIATRTLAPNPIEDTISPGLMPSVEVATIKPAPQPKKVKISVQESAKRTVITIREKVSQQKFDSIVASSMVQYKDKASMQLIVKGFNGMMYRSTIPQKDGVQSLRDTIKTQPKNKLAITAKIITTQDSIITEGAEFTPKYDSVTDTYYVQYGTKSNSKALQEPVYTAQLTLQPEFPGGTAEFLNFINKRFRYPETAKNITARIHVSFVIETDGSISNIKALKDPGYGLGAEAVRVLKLLTTKWKPGEVKGQAVRTAYFVPITVSIK